MLNIIWDIIILRNNTTDNSEYSDTFISFTEAVNCVVAGKVRAKQDLINNNDSNMRCFTFHHDVTLAKVQLQKALLLAL